MDRDPNQPGQISARHLNVPSGTVGYVSTAREGDNAPAGGKTLQAWESIHGGTQISAYQTQQTLGMQKNQNRDMNAIYKHAKQDMESLEKYMDGTKARDSPGESSGGKMLESHRREQDVVSDMLEGQTRYLQMESQGQLGSQLKSRT